MGVPQWVEDKLRREQVEWWEGLFRVMVSRYSAELSRMGHPDRVDDPEPGYDFIRRGHKPHPEWHPSIERE
jgi:hypothetical protein